MALVKLSLKGRALRLLSQREHSRLELERKLASYEEAPGSLAQALDDLQAKGFIDEVRVVDSVVHRRSAKLGAGRIKQELQAKGLAPDLVSQAVQALKASEFDRALEVWRKKFQQASEDRAAHARQGRFLLARGFSSDVVRRVLSAAARLQGSNGVDDDLEF
jgi:regulatory protein